MVDVMYGGLTAVKTVGFITIMLIYNNCNMYFHLVLGM